MPFSIPSRGDRKKEGHPERPGRSFYERSRDPFGAAGQMKKCGQRGQVTASISVGKAPALGVACLSVQQRDAIYDLIDKLGIRGDVEAFAPKDERLFVKNLEAVQGDERDVIFISVGYGVAPNQSRPFLNFGPVSRDGGERRLNVLASRAREKCIVFSSIAAADIPADTEVRGTRMLRSLLHFAETGKLGAGTFLGGEYDSPFEELVARVIREAGFHVHSQVGVSSFRIDLGVVNPARPGEYVVGVECDGATYHSARSARDRDRLRQEVLTGLGWRLHRIWSTDWFRNPARETEKLLNAIRAADTAREKPDVQIVVDDAEASEDDAVADELVESVAEEELPEVELADEALNENSLQGVRIVGAASARPAGPPGFRVEPPVAKCCRSRRTCSHRGSGAARARSLRFAAQWQSHLQPRA